MKKTTEQLEQDYRDACVRAAAHADRAARARARAAAHDSAYAAFKLWQNRLKEEELDERP
tara:strand:+ start:16039 stop:16218 length:180 start_codon:yes stop_codon:yes gene_type:complete